MDTTTNDESNLLAQSNQTLWTDTVTIMLKVVCSILCVSYLIGMLVAGRYYHVFGVSHPGLLNIDYLLSGLAWCSMAAVGFIFMQFIPYLSKGGGYVRILKSLVAIFGGLLLLYLALNEFSDGNFKINEEYTWGCISIMALSGAYVFLAVFITNKILKRPSILRQAGTGFAKRVTWLASIAVLVLLISWYGRSIFPLNITPIWRW